ncbi:hypothetical protein J2T09_000848 [Neorhizobium huautlense]|uniref:Uncharacterized protein n=1 Tax=Neorhizobium huautlense TaxID=67774 RepID=A0ABT9PPI9_9HYPH|nr:hypothetical protein [Neorhizobium huautlense]
MSLPPSALPGISPSRGEIGCGDLVPFSLFSTGSNDAYRDNTASTLPADLPSYGQGYHTWIAQVAVQPISPLEGEMSGRTEGGI